MSKESIKLDDFVKDFITAYEIQEEDVPQPETHTRYYCEKCATHYSESTKFCPQDGVEIKSETYEVKGEEYKSFVRDVFYDLSEGGEIPESFPYEFVDEIEKRGDGSGYYMNYIFNSFSYHFNFISLFIKLYALSIL
jgi:hypothetical protein